MFVCEVASYPHQFSKKLTLFLSAIHSSDCFLQAPAAGYRSNASGALGYVGERGHCWSSSSYAAGNVNAGYLYFNAGNVNPLNNANRANGFSVRCVQHLPGSCFLSFYSKGSSSWSISWLNVSR